jgi:hypothetical protein
MSYVIYDEEGKIQGFLEEADVLAYLETVPEDLYVFFVGGTTQGALDFMVQLNGQGDGVEPSFMDSPEIQLVFRQDQRAVC